MIGFLLISLLCIVLQSFFSMFEMASVSLNKVRLQYYVSKKMKKAVWLEYLLKKPSRLFGTTLIAVNSFLFIGSEASRRFYGSIGLSPDLAFITQSFLVIIFAELVPLFTAIRHSEKIAFFNVPIIYFLSKILYPIIFLMEKISYLINFFSKTPKIYLTKEEMQKAFEEKSMYFDRNKTIGRIFSIKNKQAKDIAISLELAPLLPSSALIEDVKRYSEFIILYHKFLKNVVAIVISRNLLKADPSKKVMEYGRSAWFIFEDSNILDIIKQFRCNGQPVAIVLNKDGKPVGFLTLEMISDEVFGTSSPFYKKRVCIEKNISADMSVEEFNKMFKADLSFDVGDTISDLLYKELQYHPSKGEVVYLKNFKFIIKKTSLFKTKNVLVRNIF